MTSKRRPLASPARERLIESHLPLAKSVARRYAGRGVDLDDLVQVGAVGLINAADRFDPHRGVSFSTFAEATIDGEIRHHLRDRSAPVRIPRELQRLGRRLRSRQGELAAQLGRMPTLSELADAVDANRRDVEQALAAEQAREPVSVPAAEAGAGPAVETEPFAGSDARLLLAERMHVLSERERRIVYLRFHADLTERQIARELDISQAHVSRLLTGALTKLRTELAEDEPPGNEGDITPQMVISRAGEATATPGTGSAGKAKPRPAGGYSGRFLVRMSGDLHRELARAAEREQVSLNRFVTNVLSESVTGAEAGAPAPDAGDADPAPRHPTRRSSNPARTLRVALVTNLLVVVLAGAVAVVLLVLALRQGL